MYHIFIHSSIDGHSGSFHVLAIVNSAATDTGMHAEDHLLKGLQIKVNSNHTRSAADVWGQC